MKITFYTTPLSSVIQTHNLGCHIYTGDTHNYLSLATLDTNCSLSQLRDCLNDIFHWMTDSKLKLNADNTEFLIIGTQKQHGKFDCFFQIPMLSQNFTLTISARNLGVTFNNNKSLSLQLLSHSLPSSYLLVYVFCCHQNYCNCTF